MITMPDLKMDLDAMAEEFALDIQHLPRVEPEVRTYKLSGPAKRLQTFGRLLDERLRNLGLEAEDIDTTN
jgi:hypothetical protein